MDEGSDYLVCCVAAVSRLGRDVDDFYGLRETVLVDSYFECFGYFVVNDLLFLGADNFMGCIIDEYSDTDI